METEERINSGSMSVSDWMLTLIIQAIPIVGFIMLFIWAFQSNPEKCRKNWAKAMLLLLAIFLSLAIILFFIFKPVIIGLLNDGLTNSEY